MALNKLDLADAELVEDFREELLAAGADKVFAVSGATGAGIPELLDAVLAYLPDRTSTETKAAAVEEVDKNDGSAGRVVGRCDPRRTALSIAPIRETPRGNPMKIENLLDFRDIEKCPRLVIKLGSALLVHGDGELRHDWLRSVASEIAGGARTRAGNHRCVFGLGRAWRGGCSGPAGRRARDARPCGRRPPRSDRCS